jgi:hypothetical protein
MAANIATPIIQWGIITGALLAASVGGLFLGTGLFPSLMAGFENRGGRFWLAQLGLNLIEPPFHLPKTSSDAQRNHTKRNKRQLCHYEAHVGRDCPFGPAVNVKAHIHNS